MTEEDARQWLADRGWMAGRAGERLTRLTELIVAENGRQNLIAASTIPAIWARHVVDSAQLLALAESAPDNGLWVDLGSGGGFPGLVIACLRDAPIALVEARGLRARFLADCVAALDLPHASVLQQKAEHVQLAASAAVISARAFAPLGRLLGIAGHLADRNSLWLLPKGRNAELELASARQEWQAVFHVKQSVTDADSAIIMATSVERRQKPKSRRPSGSRRA
jgi:16S rRNA (guanine527-N7)-methyltransferase